MLAQQPVIIIGNLFDQFGEAGESRPRVQILRRLPVAATRHLGTRRNDFFDFGFEVGIEGHGVRRRDVDNPKRRREKFLDFLLHLHVSYYPETSVVG